MKFLICFNLLKNFRKTLIKLEKMEENKDISQIIFDRQMRIEKWNQNKLAQEVFIYLDQ